MGFLPALRRLLLTWAIMAATVGDAADVPPTPAKDLPPESATRYGFTRPASAATSGYARPVALYMRALGRPAAVLR